MSANIFEKEHFVLELRKLLAVKNDREMADLLGVQLQTVATWRRKGTRPSLMIRRAIEGYIVDRAHLVKTEEHSAAPALTSENDLDPLDICEMLQRERR